MKKALLILCLATSIVSSFAQSIKLGIESGVNLSNLQETVSGTSSSGSMLTSSHFGVFADVGLGAWSIQPAILYSSKGGRNDVAGTITTNGSTYTYTGTEQLTLKYVEVPVNVLYHIPVVFGKIFIGGGPYVAIGTSGTDALTTTATNNGVTATNSGSTNITYGSAVGDIKNPDYGINLTGGLSLKNGVLFAIGYGLGLANLANDGSTLHNSVIRFSVGFSFFKIGLLQSFVLRCTI